MANETVTLSYKSKLKLNGTAFGVTGGSIEFVWDEHEVGDSETGRAKTHKRGRSVMNISMNFYGKEDIDYHGTPLLLATDEDETMDVEILPWGDGFTGYDGEFSMFMFKFDWAKGGELQGTLNGKSNGFVTIP